jgi:hypothetical protein
MGGRLLWPVLLLGVLTSCHLLTLVLWPSLGYLGWRRAVVDGGNRFLGIALTLLPTAAITACVLGFFDSVPWWEPRTAAANHHLPLFLEQPTLGLAYGLLSWDHLVDVTNVLLLAAPVPALLLTVVTMQGAILIISPAIGALRDWDMLALPAVPMTLWVGMQLLPAGRNVTGRAISSMLMAGGMHLALWVALNADLDGSAQRFSAWLETATLSRYARGYGASTGIEACITTASLPTRWL